MDSSDPHARFRDLLYRHGYGYPMSRIEGDSSLSSTERIKLGDVGILSDDGGFTFLWNVHSATDLPSECEPLPARNAADDNDYRNFFLENTAITSANVESKAIESEGKAGIKFSIIDSGPAAILALPRGGSRVDVADHTTYQQYAVRHAAAWHAHLRDDPRHKGKHGSLYLVTGTDTCHDSCGVAAVVSGTTIKFVASGASSIPNKWVVDGGGEHSMTAYASEKSLCVFVRGFVIAARDPTELVDGYKRDTEQRIVSNNPAAVIAAELLKKSPKASYVVVHDDYWIVPTKRGDLVKSKDKDGLFLDRVRVYAASLGNVTVQDGVSTLPERASEHPLWHGVEVPATLKTQEALLLVQKHSPPNVESTGLPSIFKCSEVVVDSSKAKPRIMAVVIGINVYQDPKIKNLEGAVPDADAVVEFLRGLQVSDDRICVLRNEQATREGIVKAISHLISESPERLAPGDPILIYYAGHGAQAGPPADPDYDVVSLAPKGWEAGGPAAHIQMLVPYDFVRDAATLLDHRGILDLELGGLLEELAEAKGDNITVISDCCHSGSITRDPLNLQVEARGIDLPPHCNTSNPAYRVLTDPGHGGSSASRGAATSLPSHVLLAACSSSQRAYETGARGNFTSALLPLLSGADVGFLTYQDIISQLYDLPHQQRPQCEGRNSSRALFNGAVPPPKPLFYSVEKIYDDYILLGGGQAHGIAPDAEFDIVAAANVDSVPLCRLRVSRTYPHCSLFATTSEEVSSKVPENAWALQRAIGNRADFVITVSPAPELLSVIQMVHMARNRPNRPPIRFVDSSEAHELAVHVEGHQAVFIITDTPCVNAGLTRLPHTVSIKDTAAIFDIIESAAHFFYHLRRSHRDVPSGTDVPLVTADAPLATPDTRVITANTPLVTSDVSLTDNLLFEAYVLHNKPDRNAALPSRLWTPKSGENLAENLMLQLELREKETTNCGFKLTSKYGTNLFVSAFLFDMAHFAINLVYQPGKTNGSKGGYDVNIPDPSILPNGSLTLGYGSGGGGRSQFTLDKPNTSVGVAYLKFFVTSFPVDLTNLPRKSPFDPTRDATTVKNEVPEVPIWQSLLIPIVYKRIGS